MSSIFHFQSRQSRFQNTQSSQLTWKYWYTKIIKSFLFIYGILPWFIQNNTESNQEAKWDRERERRGDRIGNDHELGLYVKALWGEFQLWHSPYLLYFTINHTITCACVSLSSHKDTYSNHQITLCYFQTVNGLTGGQQLALWFFVVVVVFNTFILKIKTLCSAPFSWVLSLSICVTCDYSSMSI